MFYSYSLCVCVCVFFATLFLTSRFPLFPQPLSVSASPNSFVFFPPLVNSSLLTVMFGSKFGQRLGRPLEWRLGGVWVCVWVEIGLCLGGWMKSGCARCGFGICSPWVWVLLIVGFIFIFFWVVVLLTIMLFSGGGGGNGLRSRFVFTMVAGYVVWVGFKFVGSWCRSRWVRVWFMIVVKVWVMVWFIVVVKVWVTVDHGVVGVWVTVVVG